LSPPKRFPFRRFFVLFDLSRFHTFHVKPWLAVPRAFVLWPFPPVHCCFSSRSPCGLFPGSPAPAGGFWGKTVASRPPPFSVFFRLRLDNLLGPPLFALPPLLTFPDFPQYPPKPEGCFQPSTTFPRPNQMRVHNTQSVPEFEWAFRHGTT